MSSDVFTFAELTEAVEVGHAGKTKPLSEGLSEALAKVAAAVHKAGDKGSMTLRLDFKPSGKGQIAIGASIKTSMPEPGAFPVKLFLDKRGRLYAEDPDQGKLPLESVGGGK